MREPFEYDLNDPATWRVVREPYRNPEFVEGLKRIGGLNPYGEPMLRLVWGGTLEDVVYEGFHLKYRLCKTDGRLVGFRYRAPKTKEEIIVPSLKDVPPSVLLVEPLYAADELGKLRHIVEMWVSPEALRKAGRYSERISRDPETGERILKEFPRQGHYDHFYTIQTAAGKYRAADMEVLGVIEAAWHYLMSTTQGERDQAIRQQMEEAAKEAEYRQSQIWEIDSKTVGTPSGAN